MSGDDDAVVLVLRSRVADDPLSKNIFHPPPKTKNSKPGEVGIVVPVSFFESQEGIVVK